MKRWIGLGILGLIAYLVFLLAYLPSATAYQWARGVVPGQLYGVHGTIWNGQAEAFVSGSRRVNNLSWRIHPWRLVTGRVDTRISGEFQDGRVSGELVVGTGRSLLVRDLRLHAPVPLLLEWAGRGALTTAAQGRAEVLLRAARIKGPRLLSADGIVNWNDAVISFGNDIPLGNLALRLQPAPQQGVTGKLVTRGGVLDLSGDLRLEPNGTYQIIAHISPRDPNDPKAKRIISMLQLANPRGTTVVTITGNVESGNVRVRQKSG